MKRGSQRFTTPETVPTETTWSARVIGRRDPFEALVILGGGYLCRSDRHRARSFKSLDGWIGWSQDRFAAAFVKRRRLRRSEMPSIGSRPRFARPHLRETLRATYPLRGEATRTSPRTGWFCHHHLRGFSRPFILARLPPDLFRCPSSCSRRLAPSTVPMFQKNHDGQ